MASLYSLELPPNPSEDAGERKSDEVYSRLEDSSVPRQIKKRNRIPVSCTECRRRKLRCDRNDPCSACVHRGDADLCKFSEPLSALQYHDVKVHPDCRKSRSQKSGSREFLHQRIHRLESLVSDLAAQIRDSNSPPLKIESSLSPEQRTLEQSDFSNQPSPSNGNDDSIDELKIAMGEMKISNGVVTYTSGNSWNTILDEIADIKLALNPVYSSIFQYHHTSLAAAPQRPLSFPFFAVRCPSITDLLAILPSRADTEAIVQKFMSKLITMCPCLHKPSFLQNLADFHAAPDKANPIFLGTLFSVLACGISVYMEDDTSLRNTLLQKGVSSKKEMAIVWRDASMQAFCLGGFLSDTSLENLQGLILLHTFLSHFQTSFNLGWPIYGMIVSIALSMGLHRDGALFNLGPFETEMRRRLWSILVMVDGLNAATYGRPMIISDSQFDTKPLGSMNDDDLRPGCKTPQPPSDPEQLTDTTYATCKYALTIMVRKVISNLFEVKVTSYDTIMKLDAEIRATYEKFPRVIKYVPPNKSGGVTLCVQKLGLKVIMCHALVILHRPFLRKSFKDARYVPGREKCLEAAHQVLTLFHEYRDNIEFVEYSWYMLGALHAFHAGTVVGLRCYLDPLGCSEQDWIALEKTRVQFEKIAKVDGWAKLGEKGSKVLGILIRKALEKKALHEGALKTNGVMIGATGRSFGSGGEEYDATVPFSVDSGSGSGSTGFTPQYSGPLFGTMSQYDLNPLTNPALRSGLFDPARLQGVGMAGVVTSDSSPDQTQANWDAFWPKSMNMSEWDMFFDNMEVEFSNTDSSVGTVESSNPSSTLLFADQSSPFGTSNQTSVGWDFGNPLFENSA